MGIEICKWAHEDKLVQREFEIHGMVSLESDNCVLDGTGI